MLYTVVSGDYTSKIENTLAYQAAISALRLWNCKKEKPKLSPITTVADGSKKKVLFSTPELLEQINES